MGRKRSTPTKDEEKAAPAAAGAAEEEAPPTKKGTGAAAAMGGFSMGSIMGVMQEEGPVVTCVLLKADGGKEERTLDMTPRKDAPSSVLGGKVTFVGPIPRLNVVVMQRLDAEEAGTPESTHKLPPPLHEVRASRQNAVPPRAPAPAPARPYKRRYS